MERWSDFDFEQFLSTRTPGDVKSALAKTQLSPRDFLTLLSDQSDGFLEEMAMKSKEMTEKHFGRTVQIYTPLYLGNYCTNDCLYCGFSRNQKIKRTKLTLEEVREEAQKISSSGLKHILVLTGGDRVNTSVDYIAQCVEILREFFNSISLEIYALTQEEYSRLIKLGVNNVTMYQETYDRELYGELHHKGEKADYDFRLNAPERAAAAGANSVNLGALLGLSDPVKDYFFAVLHGEYLRKKYPATTLAMSYPRIRQATGGFQPRHNITDTHMVKFICAYRLFMPRGEISVSTRESESLRNSLLPLGTTKMSAASCTTVGSRSREEESEPQFETTDKRSVAQLDRDLRAAGYQPVYKDWDIL